MGSANLKNQIAVGRRNVPSFKKWEKKIESMEEESKQSLLRTGKLHEKATKI